MNLKKIKKLGGINKNSLFFLTKDNTIIESIDNFEAKDIIFFKINKNKN